MNVLDIFSGIGGFSMSRKPETAKQIRERLAMAGEPCGTFLSQCPGDPDAHTEYFNLPNKQKDLMMKEREKRRGLS
jgi:hypothetical protein